jgi:hypothetical protein
MIFGMIMTLTIIIVPSINIINVIDLINPDPNDFIKSVMVDFVPAYRYSLSLYGIISGIIFLLLAAALLFRFKELFNLINNEHKLSKSL